MYFSREGLRFVLIALLIPLLLVLIIFFVLALRPGQSLERRRDKLSSMIDQSPIAPPEPPPDGAEESGELSPGDDGPEISNGPYQG